MYLKSGTIGYASNISLEETINKYINNMNLYVHYLIHGENISGTPIEGYPNDVCIDIIILNINLLMHIELFFIIIKEQIFIQFVELIMFGNLGLQ